MAELPSATATFLPFRSATLVIGESLGTTIVSPLAPIVAPETTSILLLAAAANSGGVLPTPPMSMAPAFSASSSGGPEVNDFHLIL